MDEAPPSLGEPLISHRPHAACRSRDPARQGRSRARQRAQRGRNVWKTTGQMALVDGNGNPDEDDLSPRDRYIENLRGAYRRLVDGNLATAPTV